MMVRVTDVEKWVGREQSSILEAPWPEALAERLEWPLLGEPNGTVTVRNTGDGLLVDVEGTAPVLAACSRCLNAFPLTLHFHETEEYRRVPPGAADNWAHYAGDEIVLDALVTDAILLAAPMAPVCRPDCRGLCPRCGANLNDGACACPATVEDPRWAALAAWRSRHPEEN
jgi:uncharacterized protein